ncbi:hypothetical protein Bpfe_017091 [Biomphalaria pfeifferi]|uniref:Interferon-induced transmembrane protein n=1 Tax=Biomphalaria pfeifferi TaxID=112525 RepID=A0AAD8BG62_BIOPF|nr:hypothetical protein Bpfe_017091 [Biomphalaria pfeifferi]
MNAQSNEGPAPVYVVVSPGPNMPPNQGTQPASGPQNMNNMASQQSLLQKFPFDVLKSASIEVTLVLSILVTLLGFLPTGVVALVFSLLSMSEYKTGNMAKAKEYCNIAQIWIVITVIVCILLWFTIIILFIMTFLFFKESNEDSIIRINMGQFKPPEGR